MYLNSVAAFLFLPKDSLIRKRRFVNFHGSVVSFSLGAGNFFYHPGRY